MLGAGIGRRRGKVKGFLQRRWEEQRGLLQTKQTPSWGGGGKWNGFQVAMREEEKKKKKASLVEGSLGTGVVRLKPKTQM